jgi:hypothetical protein
MRRTTVLCAALFGLCAAVLAAAETPSTDASPERVARLIQQLGSSRFAEREAATRSLDALGDAAVAALQSAANSSDAETRRRASELLQRIGQRAIIAKILKPTTVALDFDNCPLIDAVNTLAKQTGLKIDRASNGFPGNRKVTVKSGPIPVWEAVELFCRKADLHEWDGATPMPGVPTPPSTAIATGNVAVFGGLQGQVVVGGRSVRSGQLPDGRVILLDGPGTVTTSHHAGAVRLRVLPHGTPFPMTIMGDDLLFPLQASAESRLQFAGALSVRIEKAIDEFGKNHEATGVVVPTVNADDVTFVVLPNGAMMAQPASGRAGPAALRIARGDKAAKSIREIVGEMTAQVHVTEALARIDGPMKSGMSANGPDGVSVKLNDVTMPSAGELKISIELSLPPEVQPMGALAGVAGGRVAFQGGIVFQQQLGIAAKVANLPPLPTGTTEYAGLSIEDAQGRRWTATHGQQESMRFGPQGLFTQLVVTFKAPAADATATRLVFSGSRPAVISIPFAFRDVPLP